MRTGWIPLLGTILVLFGGCGAPEHVEERPDGSVARGHLDEEGLRTGTWREYRPDGSLHSRGDYHDGILREIDVFDDDGAIVLIYRRTGGSHAPGHVLYAYRNGHLIATLPSEGEGRGDVDEMVGILKRIPSPYAKTEMLKSGRLEWRLLFLGAQRAFGE